jgi:organic hydroperoxide reductase OsmC/OhrA
MKKHHYSLAMTWTGNTGQGTKGYSTYSRNHIYTKEGKPEILGSSDPSFRGDLSRHNPEEMLVGILSSCHMLWYLHLCSVNGIIVDSYHDDPEGTMREEADGNGKFENVQLNPRIVIRAGDLAKAEALHEEAHHFCFIANSVNFPVTCRATITRA